LVLEGGLLTVVVAMGTAAQREGGLEVTASHVPLVLGHSLGEYSALVAAGAIDFADAVALVVRLSAS